MDFDKKILAPILAYLAVIPFLVGTAYIMMGYTSPLKQNEVLHLFLSYAAIVLAFKAGFNWGYAIVSKQKFGYLLLTSTSISLIAFSFLVVEIHGIRWLAVVFAFLAQLYFDKRLLSAKLIDDWYYNIRFSTTAIIMISIVLLMAFSKYGVG